jgi:hypothetical protein
MRKTYMMLVAMVLSVLCATSAFGQKIYKAEIDASFFKAWTSNEPGATEVANPEPIDISDENPNGTPFSCDNNLYKEVGDWTAIYGSSTAYYLWYADLTGTQKMYFKGTPGFKFWVQFNRQAPEEGGDAHGGAMEQTELTIGDDGTASYDCSSLSYVHLNCIKTKGSGIRGRLTAIEIEGTIKPVSGLLPLISNGDAEGDDLSSFPVSYDGPNNGGTANDKPEIVSGVGVGGSKCFKVTSYPEPTETWHTQFYIKADEVMPKGSKWSLKMSIKADHDTKITTSAQAEPRTWKGGFISEFTVGTEWKEYTWTGEIGVDDFQSIAFDLNNSDERNADDSGWTPGNGNCGFYFDNIEFGYDLGSANPASEITAAFGVDVIEVKLTGTNIPDLVKAADGKKVILPNDCVEISWNGKPAHPVSVEGRPNGNLYIFMLDVDGDDMYDFSKDDENTVVKIGFTNPTDPACRLLFTEGKWEGEPVPDFSGVVCSFKEELGSGDYVSYIWGAADLEKAEPEDGSFNLAADLNEFTMTFNQKIEVATVVAQLGKEKLTASAAEEFSKEITLTRTGTSALAGETKLIIDHAVTDRGYDLDDPIVLKYSFGPVVADENDQPATIYESNFSNDAEEGAGAGWMVNADAGGLQVAASGSGCRILHGQGAFADDLVYIAQRSTPGNGVALYGIDEEHKLTLEAKTYHVTLGACRHDRSDVALRVQVVPEASVNTEDGSLLEDATILAEDYQEITPEKSSKEAVRFDLAVAIPEAGNYVIRLVPSKWESGAYAGYEDAVCFGDVKVEYLPSTMGLLETKTLETALENAKQTLDNNNEERYAGAAMTALDNLIKEYDSKTMTAPSAFAKATADLNAAAKALTEHVTLCNEYDALPGKAFNLYEANKGTKFEPTEYFKSLEVAVKKYCTFGTETQTDEETGEEKTVEVMESFKLFYEDDELNAAKKELSDVITLSGGWLTDEKSQNVWGHITTGYAALHERLRRGVELLKSLGVAEDAAEIVWANAELGDNDEIAEAIIKKANQIILADLAGEGTLFAGATVDDEGNEVGPSYDLSVFAKNPNIYGPANSTEVPGWTNVTGNGFAWSSWDGATNHSANTPYPEDCQIHAGWHPSNGAISQQTIENLPAGIYTVKIQCSDNNSPWSEGTCAFVKTSATPELEEEETLDPDVHYYSYIAASGDLENIEVLDGKLTVGFNFGPGSQAFLNDVEIWMTAPADGHNYAGDYAEFNTDITAAKPAKVRALEMFDLNGRRISSARKGLVIVKKVMSDGTVKTQKVVK